MLSLICLPESWSLAWNSHMKDNLINAFQINWSGKIWLKSRETSIVCSEAFKKAKAILGQKKVLKKKSKDRLVINVLFRPNTNSLNIIKDSWYLANQNCLDLMWTCLSDFKFWFFGDMYNSLHLYVLKEKLYLHRIYLFIKPVYC